MPAFRLEQLQITGRRHRVYSRWWRELCFARAVLREFRIRFALVALLLAIGAAAFWLFEPDHLSPIEALYFTWTLTFGQPPHDFPQQPLLRGLYFVLPLAGLLIILESIVEFSHMIRDRRSSERNWCMEMASNLKDHIILIGLGKLGYRTYRMLRKLGEPIVVVERDPENGFLDEVRQDGTPLLVANARRDATLVEANVAAARSIIIATNDDLANLEVALDARRMNANIRVVLRLFDQALADKVRGGFNIHIAMSTAALAAPNFALAAVEKSFINSMVIGTQLVVIQRWTVRVGGPLINRTVGDVAAAYGCGVIEHTAGDGATVLFPPPTLKLAAGDTFLVQGPMQKMRELYNLT